MGLASLPWTLAGRGVDALSKTLDGARANTVAFAGDLIGRRGDPLEERDPEFIRATLPVNRQLANVFFRPHVSGLENIPEDGPALLVGNHSGGTVIADTFVFSFAFYSYFGPERRFHQLAHDVAVRLPGLSAWLRRYGTLPASHSYAERALEEDAAVLVYPGGDHESFRPTWHSEEIEFGGRKGFVELALSQDVPIVPVVAIGGQETGLFVTRGERIARLLMLDKLLRIKVFPVILGPPFGISFLDLPLRLPLPAQITLRVLEPIDLRERFGDEPDHDEVYKAITAEMQEALDDMAAERDLPLVGAVWTQRDGHGVGADAAGEESDDEVAAGGSEESEAEGASAGAASAEAADEVAEESRAAEAEDDGGGGEAYTERTEPEEADEGMAAESASLPEAPAGAAESASLPEATAGSTDEPAPPEVATRAEAAPDAAAVPSEPADAADLPVDQEPAELVAEFAEPGAEDGAGPELRIAEPWQGYARMRVRDIADRLASESGEVLLAVRLYESAHKNRRGVLEALEQELNRR